MRDVYAGESVTYTINYPEFHACESRGSNRTAAGGRMDWARNTPFFCVCVEFELLTAVAV
jgi:hypothetical protein